jgi:hypothetical protein
VRTTAHAHSVATDDENDQRNETVSEDVPEDPPDPDPPPDRLAKQHDEPPSVELEGERRSVASFDVGLASAEMDASGASDGVVDDEKRPMNLRNASERERERSKPMDQEDSPGRPGEEPDEPGGEAAVPGNVHGTQERPRCETSDAVDRTGA